MLRHSLRVPLLLPVLVMVVALTVILAITEANRVKFEAGDSIERQSVSLQTLFSVTRAMMLDRVNLNRPGFPRHRTAIIHGSTRGVYEQQALHARGQGRGGQAGH